MKRNENLTTNQEKTTNSNYICGCPHRGGSCKHSNCKNEDNNEENKSGGSRGCCGSCGGCRCQQVHK